MGAFLYPNELVITDRTSGRDIQSGQSAMGTGWEKPEFAGYGAVAKPFPQGMLLEWDDINQRARERQKSKSQLSNKILDYGLKTLNQGGTNFCFANAPYNLVRIMNMLANQPPIDLSAASVACKITGFRNVGGFAGDVLEYMSEYGMVPTALWPTNAISQKYDTSAAWSQASKFKVTDWIQLEIGNTQQLASLLVQDIPVAKAYQWFYPGAHEITGVDYVVDDNGNGMFRDWNSWSDSYSYKGFFVVSGRNRMRFDDGVACLSFAPGLAV